ncbi:MAG: carbohydrate kinase family protein [Rhizobiales bacterium]|nr:carbohydrate kinase family protein [Hyphomicrobiales bacterium]MBO6697902.1 carbohydrate kinase family protein [Hyphomicrobiales bacterium]MBO6735844.1 carbohydrate kinase family protein [Hyphomicrobiales bacterium]MBO6913855.1 carbohydrate kinase family protein [Hyphomicrobiales bacterium]MBO6955558.1 carbohydrate kinase family protein [Hyphomicrobiales bacterium]
MTDPSLVCFGNFTIDDVVLADGQKHDGCTGGDALYATLAARAFEPASELVAPIGNDMPPDILARLEELGLSLVGMPKRDVPNLHNRVDYKADGSREWTLYSDPDHFDVLSPFARDIPPSFLGADRFLVLAMALPAQESLIEDLSGRTDALVALDPQEDYIFGNENRLEAIVAQTDIFMPSEEEVVRLTGLRDWSQAARQFAQLGPKLVIIKLGANGAYLYDKERDASFEIPVFDGGKVVDTTGAGDSFCGAFMAMMGREAPEYAALAGAVAASVTVSGYGVDPLLTTPSNIIAQRYDEWRSQHDFRLESDGVHRLRPNDGA